MKQTIIEQIENNINGIIGNNREITKEQFEDLQLLEDIYIENQGVSGTNTECDLYGIFRIDENGNQIGNELREIVVLEN
jgi:hypothetical protein